MGFSQERETPDVLTHSVGDWKAPAQSLFITMRYQCQAHMLKFSRQLSNAQIAFKFSLPTVGKAQMVNFNATETLAIAMWLGKQSHTSLRIPPPCVEPRRKRFSYFPFLGDIPNLVSVH